MAEQLAEQQDNTVLPTLTCSIEGEHVLLPGVAVAEIIEYSMVESYSEDAPHWLLGRLPWRGIDVPLISLESLNHGAFFTKRDSLKIIVVNALYDLKEHAYWAFVALDTPRLNRIAKDALLPLDEAVDGEVAIMKAELEQLAVTLVDVNKIENLILEAVESL